VVGIRRWRIAEVTKNILSMDLNTIFTQIRDKLDAHYDRRERLIKISRDITALSKKMIFSLHRIQGDISSLPAGIQKEVDQREAEIQQLLEKAKPDIQGANAYRYESGDLTDNSYNRQISPGIQEYVRTVCIWFNIRSKH
jgi:predicted translin family RNA/ssDNA-binding protein